MNEPFESYGTGVCAACGSRINPGDLCRWGAERGQRVHDACSQASGSAAPVPMRPSETQREWSSYQKALFDWGVKGAGSALVIAVAGSGKTASLEELTRRLPAHLQIKYLVFNKRNAQEARERMPAHVDAATFHASCNAHLSRRLERPRVDAHKCRKLFGDMVNLGIVTEREADAFGGAIGKLVGLAKNEGIGALVTDTPDAWRGLIDHYGIEINAPPEEYRDEDEAVDRVVEIAHKLLAASNAKTDVIDFDDMLYLTVKLHVALPRYDMVCVDEAQDTNRIQRAILHMMVKPDGRLAAVGDPKQSLYGFRGSDAQAMERIGEEFGCVTLPLSINYRCGRAIVAAAQQYCPELEAWERSPEGSVETLGTMAMQDFLATDAVLCRVTAPLVTLAYRLLAANVGGIVLGRDIGEGLLSLIKRMQGKRKAPLTIEELSERLEEWRQREVTRWTARGEDEKAQSAQDKVESLMAAIDALPEDSRTLLDLIDRIQTLFSDDGTGRLTLATVHKCVHPDTLVESPLGLTPISALASNGVIATPTGPVAYRGLFSREEGPALKVTTAGGFSVTVTPEHGMTRWAGDDHERIEAGQLAIGDVLRLRVGATIDAEGLAALPTATSGNVRERRCQVPSHLDARLGELLGMLVADGTLFPRGFRLAKRYQSVVDRASDLVRECFGIDGKQYLHGGKTPCVEVASTFLARWLGSLGGLNPHEKGVPEAVLRSPLVVQAAFLRGLFEDGTVNSREGHVDHIHWENRDPDVAGVVQIMLLRFGIVATRRTHHRITTLYLYGEQARRFAERIGFVAAEKTALLTGATFGRATRTVLPVAQHEMEALRPVLHASAPGNWRRGGTLSRDTLQRACEAAGSPAWLVERLGWHYDPIVSIEPVRCPSMCLTVPEGGRFLQNGFDGWNSKGLEWDRVFILDRWRMPSKWARQDWQKAQEENCLYVAYTRARQALRFVNLEDIKDVRAEKSSAA